MSARRLRSLRQQPTRRAHTSVRATARSSRRSARRAQVDRVWRPTARRLHRSHRLPRPGRADIRERATTHAGIGKGLDESRRDAQRPISIAVCCAYAAESRVRLIRRAHAPISDRTTASYSHPPRSLRHIPSRTEGSGRGRTHARTRHESLIIDLPEGAAACG
jgi:hypothetical protein